jgi:hypothetical protein
LATYNSQLHAEPTILVSDRLANGNRCLLVGVL